MKPFGFALALLLCSACGNLQPESYSLKGDFPGLEDGMSADEFSEKFKEAIEVIKADDEIILLGDIVGGSPMTNAIAQISERGMESQTIVFGGMNLAMALTAAIMKDGMETELLKENLINEAKDAIKEFPLASGDEDEDEDDDI